MRVAVIGVGSMGLNHLRVYTDLDDVEVVGAADINEERLDAVRDRFSTAAYKDYR